MKYIDVFNEDLNVLQTILALDLQFKTTISDNINIRPYTGFLYGASNISQALTIINNNGGVGGSGGSGVSGGVAFEGANSNEYIFNHEQGSEFLDISVWVLEDVGWQNKIVPITIIDQDNIKVQLPTVQSCRIVVQNIQNITKTYGI